MPPQSADQPPAGSNWIHEIKHDGYRLMARRDTVGILTGEQAQLHRRKLHRIPTFRAGTGRRHFRFTEQASCSYSEQEQVPPIL
jgi:hypothetical protein